MTTTQPKQEANNSKQSESARLNVNEGLWTLKHIYPEDIPFYKDYKFPPFQLKKKNNQLCFRCLICMDDVFVHQRQRIRQRLLRHFEDHGKVLDEEIKAWLAYVNFWTTNLNNLDLEIIEQQVYFDPFFDVKTKCLLCHSIMPYEEIAEHVKTELHIKKLEIRLKILNKQNSKQIIPVKIPEEILENHDIVKSYENENNDLNQINLLQNMERRYKEHLRFLQEHEDGRIYCKCCETIIELDRASLHKHLEGQVHVSTSGIERNEFRSFCGACYRFVRNNRFFHHTNECDLLVKPNRRIRFEEFECYTCRIVIWGDEKVIKAHERYVKDTFLTKELKDRLDDMENVIANLEQQSQQMVQKEEEAMMVVNDLQETLQQDFPFVKLYVFGSRFTGLGNLNCDLDIFVDIGNMYKGIQYQGQEQQKIIIEHVGVMLKLKKDKVSKFKNVICIGNARTPIVKIQHIPTKIDCDLSFRHGLSMENSIFVKICLFTQPKLKHLILFIKNFMKNSSLCDKITTYALTMMCIFLLQQNNHLPSVSWFYKANEMGCLVNGWHTIKYTRNGLQKMSETYPTTDKSKIDLITSFFKYYSEFDYHNLVISPLFGYPIEKNVFRPENLKKLPSEMAPYVYKIVTDNGTAENFRYLSQMCVQDPFDLSHNLTKAFSQVKNLKTFYSDAFKHLNTPKQ